MPMLKKSDKIATVLDKYTVQKTREHSAQRNAYINITII